MSIQSGIAAMGRRVAESLQSDMSCVVDRVTGRTLDEATGLYVDVYTVQYAGPCRLRTQSGRVFSLNVADQQLTAQRPTLSLPIATSGAVQSGDRFTVASCNIDPLMIGFAGLLKQPDGATAATARRFMVEVIRG